MRPDLRRTRRALTWRYSAFVAVLLMVFAVVVDAEVRRSRQELLQRQVQQLAAEAAAQLPLLHHELDEWAEADQPRRLLEQGHAATRALAVAADPGQRIRWFDDQRRELRARGGFRPAGATVPPAAAAAHPQWLPLANGLAYWQPVAAAPSSLQGYVSVAVASAEAEGELRRLRQALLLGIVLAALVAVAAGGWLVTVSLEPVRRQIESLIRFTADASHELRHPLTATRALIGSLRHGPLLGSCPAELRHKLDQIDQASLRMAHLLDDLLLLSRSDRAIQDPGGVVALPLHELVDDLVDLHQAEATAAGLRLQARIEAPACVRAHPGRVQQLLENLLSNALRFSPPGGTVTVALSPGHRQVLLWVDDQGPGIPPEQRALVFERFWQADASRSGPDHHGLGLAIAQAIAVSHGGRLQVMAAPAGGCRMQLQLPLLAS
jgi:signal transduction histidine kinase